MSPTPDDGSDPFDPLAPAPAVPHEELAELRARCPVARTPSGYSYLTRYQDILDASRAVTTFEGSYVNTDRMVEDEMFLPFIPEPRHGRIRRVINAAIATHRLGRIEAPLRDLCDRLLVPIVGTGTVDVATAFIDPIPAAAIGYLLGLDDADHPRFRTWAERLFAGTVLGTNEERDARKDAMREISAYLDEQIAWRAAADQPPDDFITRLIATEADGEHLSHLACRTQLIFLLVAGVETTRNLIGNLVLRFARDPALYAQVRADAGIIPAVVEESLRLDPPLTFLLRRTTEPVTVADVHLDTGSLVAFGLASANRDDAMFPDPDRFDIERADLRRHLAFGDGPHVCPGATLARLEARVAVETLAARVQHLELPADFTFAKTPVPFTNGPVALPLSLD